MANPVEWFNALRIWVESLWSDPDTAARVVANPTQALADAGFGNVTADQLASVEASVAPSALALGQGDPVAGLQSAVADHYGLPLPDPGPPPAWFPTYQPTYQPTPVDYTPGPTYAPTSNTTVNEDNSLHFDPSFNMGDVTLGDKVTAAGGSTAIDGPNFGPVASGGSALGTGATASSGPIFAGEGSNVGIGRNLQGGNTTVGGDQNIGNRGPIIHGQGTGSTGFAGGDMGSETTQVGPGNAGTVVTSHGAGTTQVAGTGSGGVIDTTHVHGSQTTTNVSGQGNVVATSSTSTDNSTHVGSIDASQHTDNSTHIGGGVDVGSHNVDQTALLDQSQHTSVHSSSVTGIQNHISEPPSHHVDPHMGM
jgi:hypothetical protein